MRGIILAILNCCIADSLSIQLRHEDTPHSAEAQNPGCRIVSPVPGAAFGPSSTIVSENRYFRVEGHMYDFSAGQTFEVHLAVFPSAKDGTEHSARRALHVEDGRTCVTNSDENTIFCFDAFQEHEVDIITDGHDILFKISVILPTVSGRYTFVFRWAQRENSGSNPLVGFCKTDYEILDAEVPADVESLYIPPQSLPIASGWGGDPCVDKFYCSDEYRELLHPSETTREQLHRISAQQVLAETRICEPDCRKEDELLTVILRVHSRPGMFQESLAAIINSNAPISRVWVIANEGSPHVDFFRERTESAKKGNLPTGLSLDFFSSTLDTGYYEAFLRALLTDTPYVAIIDDDLLIGKDFFRVALHALRYAVCLLYWYKSTNTDLAEWVCRTAGPVVLWCNRYKSTNTD
jgi:hypothetical protein